MRFYFLVLVLFSCSFNAISCSIAPGYQEFFPKPYYRNKNITPSLPVAKVVSITRGHNDGNGGSCSDAGIIKIQFDKVNPVANTGYKLKIVKGKFEESVIPTKEIMPSTFTSIDNSMFFVWLDGGDNTQSPIDFTLEIVAISPEGLESEPFYLQISDSGGKSG
tara:strand:+ start:419 stop:907 length:489 start_codon:yes stop_codon:yes gene_type:complete